MFSAQGPLVYLKLASALSTLHGGLPSVDKKTEN